MQILGYVGYTILIFFAVTWTLGVRIKLGAGLFTIMGALFYMVAAISLGVLGINKLHSWWLLPSGFIFVWLCTLILAHRVPLLYSLVTIFGSVYAGIVRIGIPSEKIQDAGRRDAVDVIDRFSGNKRAKLIQAAKDGDLQNVQILLADATDAINSDCPELALVNARDNDGKTAIGWAAYKGHTEIVKLLLEKGADVNAKNNKGVTALMLAAEQNHMEITKLLLAKDADINAKTTDNGQTALMTAATKSGRTAIVRLLLENGADINAKANKGATALLTAVCTGDTEAVNILLEKGADVDASTDNGITALLVARKNGHADIAQLLEKAGAKK
jgi:ankyrin repeat protein